MNKLVNLSLILIMKFWLIYTIKNSWKKNLIAIFWYKTLYFFSQLLFFLILSFSQTLHLFFPFFYFLFWNINMKYEESSSRVKTACSKSYERRG